MNIKLVPVTAENEKEILALKVQEDQRGFIETTAECLEEAQAVSVWRPVGIYDGEIAVGFAMYGEFKNEGINGRVWLDRLLIGAQHQRKGYGRKALELLLERLVTEYGCDEIYLSLYQENQAALAIYQKLGFAFNGEIDTNRENVMVLKRPAK